jgi:hypothetical protein
MPGLIQSRTSRKPDVKLLTLDRQVTCEYAARIFSKDPGCSLSRSVVDYSGGRGGGL